jgi:hypothetical protein
MRHMLISFIVDTHYISFNHIYRTIMTLGEKPSVQKLFEIAPPPYSYLQLLVQVMRPVSKNPTSTET